MDKQGEARCPYFGRCGGCAFQDIPYLQQVEDKTRILAETLKIKEIEVFTGPAYHYRQRMDFVFHAGGLGLREKGRWYQIVDIENCVIANHSLNQLMSEVRDFFQEVDVFDVRKKVGTFRYAVIRTPPADSSISIVLNQDSPRRQEARELIKEFAARTSAHNVLITYVPPNRDVSISEEYEVIKGSDHLREELLGQTFLYPIQGFFQNNHLLTEKLQLYCQQLLAEEKENYKKAFLLDLYAGVGTFGLINANLFKKVILVENHPPSLEAARRNIAANHHRNIEPLLHDAKYLKNILLPQPLIVIADPPRSGVHPRALKYLNRIRPQRILYVSCNIRQLRTDLSLLSNFRVNRVALFDFFPHTPHIEAVVELLLI
jgi:tRNA (uracil-5-)-methyltransferase